MRISSMLSGVLSFQRVAIKPVLPTFQSYSFPCPTVQGMMRDAYTALTFTHQPKVKGEQENDYVDTAKRPHRWNSSDLIEWGLNRMFNQAQYDYSDGQVTIFPKEQPALEEDKETKIGD